ncbi:MAG: hypothetical protein K5893_07885 [Prevotella sp.]|nr:hypothetical protein [Prevotella sp.]
MRKQRTNHKKQVERMVNFNRQKVRRHVPFCHLQPMGTLFEGKKLTNIAFEINKRKEKIYDIRKFHYQGTGSRSVCGYVCATAGATGR